MRLKEQTTPTGSNLA